MEINSTYKFFQDLRDDSLCFIYQGAFYNTITAMIIDLLENSIDESSGFSNLRNKISFLTIETFQNIIRHGDNPIIENQPKSRGLFLTRNIGDFYYITSANLIENENIPSLEAKLTRINTLDKDELKTQRVDILTNSDLSQKGGAGLGLIEMARKSGQKLDYYFEKLSEIYSLFYLQLKLMSKKASTNEVEVIPIEIAKNFHDIVSDENIFLILKGNFSQDAIKPILRMVENNIQAQDINVQKVTFHVLVEMLQNISKHSQVQEGIREGIFLMGKQEERYIITTGNFISSDKVEPLSVHIDQLNSLNKQELDILYRKTLVSDFDKQGSAGLGLIDIARESKEKIEYSFNKVSDETTFFTLFVSL